MKYMAILLLVVLPFFFWSCQKEKATMPVPERRSFVNDYASVFTPEEAATLDDELKEYEKETCHQILVLTVISLQGEPISEFSTRTATAWEIGQPMINNGVLLTIAMEEGDVRLEAASGLDFLINDGSGELIIAEKMLPLFREGLIAEGIQSGVHSLMQEARRSSYPDDHRPAICR